ncbi:murein transglycosylase A [Thiovibrio sp. JS02]
MVLFFCWGAPALAASSCEGPATTSVGRENLPDFSDDLDLEALGPAIEKSLNYLGRLPQEQRFPLCGETRSVRQLADSLKAFQRLIAARPGPRQLRQAIAEQFTVCKASGREADGRMLLTGYFAPLFAGSLQKTEKFRYPLYRPPADLVSGQAKKGRPAQVGRIENGVLVPYWTRAEIEKGGLLAGQELVYLADPVDVFILHIQGSGQVWLGDGGMRRVQFAGKNGHDYRSIGRFLVEKGIMRLEEVTLPRIVRYLKEHPAEQEEILHHNDSFVFFRWGDDSACGPLGCLGEPLTPGRSVALDQDCFPPGALAFLVARKPRLGNAGKIVGWGPMRRFVLNQDSGSAIKGPARLDFFWGSGQYAEVAAGHMKHPGNLYFLIKKK